MKNVLKKGLILGLMLLVCALNVCAADDSETTPSFSVTLPTKLEVYQDFNGTVDTAENFDIQNNGTYYTYVSGISVTGINGWTLVDADTDLSAAKLNSKQFTLTFADQAVAADGSWTGTDTEYSMDADNSLNLSYSLQMSRESASAETEIADIVVTVAEVPAYAMLYDDGSIRTLPP